MKLREYCFFCKGQLDDKEDLVQNPVLKATAHLRCTKVKRWTPPVSCGECLTPIRSKMTVPQQLGVDVYPCEHCGGTYCEKCCEARRRK